VAVPPTIARLNKGRLNAFRLNWIGVDVAAPTAPGNLTATAQGGHAVALSWQTSTDNYRVQGYQVERCKGTTCTDWELIAAVNALTYLDSGVVPGTTYRYRVRAYDAIPNFSAYSNLATVTTADLINIFIKVGGVWTAISQYARVDGATVTQALNEVADTLQLRIDGRCPYALKGVEIIWADAENVRQFAGHVTAVRTTYEGRAKNRVYECDCIDYTWLLNSRKVTRRFTYSTVSTIVFKLVTEHAPAGFTVTATGLTNDLPLDEITFTNEELAQAISRTMERAGAYWYVDYDLQVVLFNSTAIPSAGTIDQTHARQSAKLAKHEDYVPVATRVFGRGNGATVSVDVAPGSPTLPIDDASWYSVGGGQVECGPQRIAYLGVSNPGTGALVGTGNAPSDPPSIAGALGSNLGAGLAYQYAVTFVTASGETLPGPVAIYTPTGSSVAPAPAPIIGTDIYDSGIAGASWVVGGSYRIAWEKYMHGGAKVAGIPSAPFTVNANYFRLRIPGQLSYDDPNIAYLTPYRTTNGGGTYYRDSDNLMPAGTIGTTTTGDKSDSYLSTQQIQGNSGASLLGALVTVPKSNRPGVTGRKIYRTAANGSQLKLLATIPDNTTTSYTDTTLDGALGATAPVTDTSALLGGGQINAGATAILVSSVSPFTATGGWVRVGERVLRFTGLSGSSLVLAEPLPSTLSYGAEIVNAPHLTGIPPSGQTGAIVEPIAKGDQAFLFLSVQDQAAIDALAAATGGDGLRDEFLTDGRLGLLELTARVQATLTMRKGPLVTVTFETRDPAVTVGKTITFNTTDPPIVGTFLIQRVTISDFQAKGSIGRPSPLRVVEASSRRYTFDDLVQQIKLLGRIN
jgi:hypothetical protein